MRLKDLTPQEDIKGGSPKSPSGGIPVSAYQQQMNPQNNHSKLTNSLQILQILVIALFAVAWWTKRESGSDVAIATQNLAIGALNKRMDSADKRFDAIDARADKALESATKNADDLHELMVKFRIMVELVDGNQKKPELHK